MAAAASGPALAAAGAAAAAVVAALKFRSAAGASLLPSPGHLFGDHARRAQPRRLIGAGVAARLAPPGPGVRGAAGRSSALAADRRVPLGVRHHSAWRPDRVVVCSDAIRFSEYPVAQNHIDFLATEVEPGLDLGSIEEVMTIAAIAALVCFRSTFVVHTAQKPRVFYDEQHVNSFTAPASSTYESLPELAQSLRPGEAILTWDVKDV